MKWWPTGNGFPKELMGEVKIRKAAMPLIDPLKRRERQDRRKERRAQIWATIKNLWQELNTLTDEAEDEVREFIKSPGAPDLNPDTDRFGK